jgi:hypothetical protein
VTAGAAYGVHDLAGLLDDAAIFPPGLAPLPAAVRAHLTRRTTWIAPLVGSFVVRGSDLPGLRGALDALPAFTPPLALSVVTAPDALPAAVGAVAADPRLRLHALEVPLGPEPVSGVAAAAAAVADAVPHGVVTFVEPGWGPALTPAIAELAGTGLRLKLRCGGLVATAFPGSAALAGAVVAAVRHGVPFKATAGLHHAVRHTDPATGFEHHGFVNLLAATARAEDGPDVARALLDERDPRAVAGAVLALGPEAVRRTLATRFGSFGTCDVDEPVQDLAGLGLLTPAGAAATR